jgi:hypothetical protein
MDVGKRLEYGRSARRLRKPRRIFPSNVPGARIEASGWTDSAGNLWLFGGSPGPKGQFNLLNDLWRFSSGEWTWMGGSSTTDQSGTYGFEGVSAVTNAPGARAGALTWIDSSGNLWLFGGDGYASTAGVYYFLNDLWKYDAGQWTWVSGAKVVNQTGSYGTQGVPAAANVPGARYSALSWIDASGNLCLFGGTGFATSDAAPYYLNDLWCYQP